MENIQNVNLTGTNYSGRVDTVTESKTTTNMMKESSTAINVILNFGWYLNWKT